MKYLKSYEQIFEGSITGQSVYDACEELLSPLPLWQSIRDDFDRSIQLEIDTESDRTADAHFDLKQSTPERVVVQMARRPMGKKDKGSLAHELVHVLQHLSGSEGDLPFITDATRDINELSDHPTWERIVYAIYLSCPQECESWQAGNIYYRHKILDEMIPWMQNFDPTKAAEELSGVTPDPNQWEISSFEEFPRFWSDAYEAYDEIKDESDIPNLRDLELKEFLSHYDELFKRAAKLLS
jgi:hypothetical protein